MKAKFEFNEKKYTIVINRWQKYGLDRVYVQDERKKLGYYDVQNDSWEMNLSTISPGWVKEMKNAVLEATRAGKI